MTPFEALSGIANACQVTPNLIGGGQPSADQLAAFKAAGGAVDLDIRDPMEPRPMDEPATAKGEGLEYINIPVVTGTQTDDLMDRLLAVLRNNKGKQILLHCNSGNRVGGALIAYLMLDHGMDEEAATELAMKSGLRSAEMMQWGLDYAAERKG